jgi:hypothetical protein
VQGNDNPLLVYAVLWQALLEIDGVTRMLSLILTKKGTEWSESAASELQVVLDGLPFENVTDLYNGAMTSFFVDHPRSASGIMLFLMGYLKNSEQLIKRLQMPDGVEQRARTTSTP